MSAPKKLTRRDWLAAERGYVAPRLSGPCLRVALVYPHPPFAVAEPFFSMHDRAAVPLPLPANFAGKPRFMRAIHERYGLARLDESDWREIVATYYGMTSRGDDQLQQQ